jgi:hypothetical protein
MYMRTVRENQRLGTGILAGAGAALLGAVAWAVVTGLTHYQLGLMAIAVGLLVGFAVRHFGRGITAPFGISGAVLALLGCVAGNVLAVCVAFARQEHLPVFSVLSTVDLKSAWGILADTSEPMDALFYGIAVYEGYRFSFRRISQQELSSLIK